MPTMEEEITVGTGMRSLQLEPPTRWRAFTFKYGLAVIAIGITLAISILLTRNAISINLSILVAIAILIPTWYGWKGPGLFVAATFQVITLLSRPPTFDGSIVAYIFTHVSVLSVFVGMVFLVASRRSTEKTLMDLNATLEKRVEERTAQLHASNEELEAFSYSVSHDLRAPLRHINGFSLALLEDYSDRLDDVGKGYLNQVREASIQMAGLIDDVLKLARLSRSEMVFEAVNLSQIAQSIVDDLKMKDPKRTIETTIEPDLIVNGDKGFCRFCVTNLLSNSWKFTSKTKSRRSVLAAKDQWPSHYFVRITGRVRHAVRRQVVRRLPAFA